MLDAGGAVPRGWRAAVGMALVVAQMVGDMCRTLRPGSVRFAYRDADGDLTHRLAEEQQRVAAGEAARLAEQFGLIDRAMAVHQLDALEGRLRVVEEVVRESGNLGDSWWSS